MSKNNQKKSILAIFIRLTLVFIFAQIALIYFTSGFILQNSPLQQFLKLQALNSDAVVWGWVQFGLSQCALYILFVFTLWWLTRATAIFLRLSWASTRLLALILFCFAFSFIFFANQYYFPNSVFAFLPQMLNAHWASYLTGQTMHTLIFISGAMLVMVGFMACLGTLLWAFKNPISIVSLLIFVIAVTAYEFYYKPQPVPIETAKLQQPNIIIIGVDSLMPTRLTYTGADKSYMPTVDEFLKRATIFTHSLTPLARTSPAWASILTGNYPKKTNIRYNLTDPSAFTIPETLPKRLQQYGYYTVFATDDRQFDQIDERFGFNHIIGAKRGLNNFLFSQINDFPLSNLVMMLPIAQRLFPYTYNNRAHVVTYVPENYNQQLNKEIARRPKNKPLFLAVHFALPHWPFYYANLIKNKNLTEDTSAETLYNQTLMATDQQIKQLLATLKKQHLLDNTLVIFLSDHGTSFGHQYDRITQKANYLPQGSKPPFHFYTKNFSYGHGTDVLSLTQYHTVLAMRYFGQYKQSIGEKNSVVSLIDIAPTILNFLNIQSPYKMQGLSLLSLINSSDDSLPARPVYIESGFTLTGILSSSPKAQEVLKEGLSYYQVQPESGLLMINPIFVPMAIKGKNRAIISPPWMLAYYPNQHQAGSLVLVNLITKQWTTDFNSQFAQQSPFRALATQLKRFYGDEIKLR